MLARKTKYKNVFCNPEGLKILLNRKPAEASAKPGPEHVEGLSTEN
jgi:hypothetical protein